MSTRAQKKTVRRAKEKEQKAKNDELLMAAKIKAGKKIKKPLTHTQIVHKLINENLWNVERRGIDIILRKAFGIKKQQIIGLTLKNTTSNSKTRYRIEPLHYTFKSSTSHYNYFEPEDRWTRNKMFIKAAIKFLQNSEVWEYIENKKSFIQVNDNNTRLEEKDIVDTIQEELQGLIY